MKDDVPPRQQEEQEVKQYAFISKRAIENDHIGFCYRDYPELNLDSGWRFLFGDEDEDYLDNPTNSEAIYPEFALTINPALDTILSAPIGSEFEWDEDNLQYQDLID
ncbi:DUF2185 domain-containing protein [Bacteroidales bacterium OttesenSCG-928-J19]|nr:DUF2185 domain-containing protein [Bacteroidales bacterium OttesenSCG-928-J19]